MLVFAKDSYSQRLSEIIEPVFMVCKDLNRDKSLTLVADGLEAALAMHSSLESFDEGFIVDPFDTAATHLNVPFAEIGPGEIAINPREFIQYLYIDQGIETTAGLYTAMNAVLRLLNFNKHNAWDHKAAGRYLQAAADDLKKSGVKNVDFRFLAVSKKIAAHIAQERNSVWLKSLAKHSKSN